jgi:hypothetical protein
MPVNWQEAQQKAARTARWAVTMVKVRIRQVVSRTRWQLVTFYGKAGAESAEFALSTVNVDAAPCVGGQ